MKNFVGNIKCRNSELSLKPTLSGGQSFRWKLFKENETKESWIGVMQECLWILSQSKDYLEYKMLTDTVKMEEILKLSKKQNDKKSALKKFCEETLTRYFRLDTNLTENYEKWKTAHSHFQTSASSFTAIRVLDQEPLENIISFICSQNNNIKRISAMIDKLCSEYGRKISSYNDVEYFAFPSLKSLPVDSLEEHLRREKFGYRAGYISKAVDTINKKGGTIWLNSLKALPYTEARQELISLPGIGPKVADCVCLMSLGHLDAVPVDTHIYKVALEHYLPNLRKTKTITTKAYEEVGNVFREIYGPLAGWAQTVIFCSDLGKFNPKSGNK